ncbi:MAG: hypothetical protein FIB01_00495, partial [Gemmatimonadetes bacterium]|nr:hypothetical protein [Gemmatimonadota bacterium]
MTGGVPLAAGVAARREPSEWVLVLLLVVAAVLPYLNSLANGYALDDVFIIQLNDRVHRLADLRGLWLTPYWPYLGSEAGLYRPLTIFLFAVQWAVGGGAPWLFHSVN